MQHKVKPDTTGMRHKVSRALTATEIQLAERWFDSQVFMGRVVRDPSFSMTLGYYCQAHFEQEIDLMLFKLTWC